MKEGERGGSKEKQEIEMNGHTNQNQSNLKELETKIKQMTKD